MLCAHNSLISV